MELTLEMVASWTAGKILQGNPDTVFKTYNFDSRKTVRDELFFALKGERDGHVFVEDAWRKGAGGAVVSQRIENLPPSFALLQVADPLEALQQLAHKVLKTVGAKVVGITGSVGKTTTKDFTAAILSRSFRVVKSEKNFNNEIGLPLTLLQLSPGDDVVVAEMAMRGPGEIRKLTAIAAPDVAVVTGVHPVHLEFFPSIEAIAAAKQEIILGTKPDGAVVLNGDDPFVMEVGNVWKGKRILFGFSPHCQVKPVSVTHQGYEGFLLALQIEDEEISVHFPFFYEAFIYDLLAALSVARLFSVSPTDMAKATEDLKPSPGRGEMTRLNPGICLVDDTYNSNPRALEEALRSLRQLPARRRLAVLGDMLELGQESAKFHRAIGQKLAEYGWDWLLTVGELSLEIGHGARQAGFPAERILSFTNQQDLVAALEAIISPGDLILIKGSRAMKLEGIVEELKKKRGG